MNKFIKKVRDWQDRTDVGLLYTHTHIVVYLCLFLMTLPILLNIFLQDRSDTSTLISATFAAFAGIASISFSWLRSFTEEKNPDTFLKIFMAGQLSFLAAFTSLFGATFKFIHGQYLEKDSLGIYHICFKLLYVLCFVASFFIGIATCTIVMMVLLERLKNFHKKAP